MRYFEVINETTEEDRAIISLGSAIYDRIKRFEDIEPDTGDLYSSDYDDYDPETYDFDDEPKPDDELIVVGRVGDLFNTPLNILDPVTVELQTTYGITERMSREKGDVTRDPDTGVVLGLWYPHNSTMVLNKDYLGSRAIKSTIMHELRHALDDYKSDFKASDSSKYATPKNPEYRGVKNHPELGNVNYLAEPAEINARFVQILNDMVPVVEKASKMEQSKADTFINDSLRRAMEIHKIYNLFPEKEASSQYRRLMRRAEDFIKKERESLEKATK